MNVQISLKLPAQPGPRCQWTPLPSSSAKPFVGWPFTYTRVCVPEMGIGKHRKQQRPDSSYWSSLSAVFVVQKTGENGQEYTSGWQKQPRQLPARSLASTFWKVRFCEVRRFLKLPHPCVARAVPSAENVTILLGCGSRNVLVPGLRVWTPPATIGPIKGGQNRQHVRHVSIISGPSGTTVIELHIHGQPAHIQAAEYSPLISSVLSSPSLRGPV
mmetsp:Transcript_16965/g.49746  ORF Transcript_16965/g.49746 Transcript_16965/m.49746 type:complete len:215 (+) Transcript_16965:111-755(+)